MSSPSAACPPARPAVPARRRQPVPDHRDPAHGAQLVRRGVRDNPPVGQPSLPTLAALRQARASREALLRRVLPIGFGALVIVVVATSRAKPDPGLHGASLGVTLALAGFALAAIGGFAALVVHRTVAWLLVPVLILLMVSSSVLVWLQPDGAGPVGLLIAVGVAARIIPGRISVVMLTVCLGFLLVAESLSQATSIRARWSCWSTRSRWPRST